MDMLFDLYVDYLVCSTSYTAATGLSRLTDKKTGKLRRKASINKQQLFWPANSVSSMTPFGPHITAKYTNDSYKEQCS